MVMFNIGDLVTLSGVLNPNTSITTFINGFEGDTDCMEIVAIEVINLDREPQPLYHMKGEGKDPYGLVGEELMLAGGPW